jgi:hypothetical protein
MENLIESARLVAKIFIIAANFSILVLAPLILISTYILCKIFPHGDTTDTGFK